MKICAISDLHGHLPYIEPCDVLAIAGDICPHFERQVGGRGDIFGQAQWLADEFSDWLDGVPATEVVGCWGNHDWIGQKRPDLVPKHLRWHLLTDQGVEVLGLKVWGSPWQPHFRDWAFNAPPGLEGEAFLAAKWAMIPRDTNILIVHGPPHGYGDVAPDGRPTGSLSLAACIADIQPSLSVHGHIHCGRGVARLGETIVVNASVLDEQYRMVHVPMYFKLKSATLAK